MCQWRPEVSDPPTAAATGHRGLHDMDAGTQTSASTACTGAVSLAWFLPCFLKS